MKTNIMTLFVASMVLVSLKALGFDVFIPPGNIVRNGNFQANFTDWSGNIPAILDNWSSVPNNYAALANDIYQDLSTSPGQQYALSFYAAADLYFGPSVTIDLALNDQTLTSFTTPPYTYNPGVNRYDQMRWEQLTASFVASSSTTRLEFVDVNTYDFGLAAVSVIPVPEPATTALILMAGIVIICRFRPKDERCRSQQPLRLQI